MQNNSAISVLNAGKTVQNAVSGSGLSTETLNEYCKKCIYEIGDITLMWMDLLAAVEQGFVSLSDVSSPGWSVLIESGFGRDYDGWETLMENESCAAKVASVASACTALCVIEDGDGQIWLLTREYAGGEVIRWPDGHRLELIGIGFEQRGDAVPLHVGASYAEKKVKDGEMWVVAGGNGATVKR